MIYWFLMHGLQLILDLFELSWRSDHEKDAEILLLRYQLRLATRELKRGPALPLLHKLLLAVLANRLLRMARGARHKLALDALLFTPDTLITWHHALVRRKWTHKPKRKPGRPRKDPDLEALVVQMKRENPRWGYDKIEGELLKLGFDIDWSTVRNILLRHGLVPAPEHPRNSWRATSLPSRPCG